MFLSIDTFVHVVYIDVIFNFVDDEGDSSKGFVEVVVIPHVSDGVKDPGQKYLQLIEVVDFLSGLLNFFHVDFLSLFLAEARQFFIECVQSLPDEILHAVLVKRGDTVEEEKDEEGDDTTDKAEQLDSSGVIESVVIKHTVVIEGKVPGIVVSKSIDINSFVGPATVVVISLTAAGVIFVSEDNFCHGDVFLQREGIWVSQIVEFYHLILEILREYVHSGN